MKENTTCDCLVCARIVLSDQSVSRLHARISRDGNRFFITVSINLLKLPSSQGIVGEKSFVASR